MALDSQGGSIVVEVQPGPAASIGAAAQPRRAHDDAVQRLAAARAGCGGGDSEYAEPASIATSPPTPSATRPPCICCSRAWTSDGIALWLGHESPTTTHQYIEADLAMKEKALARLQDPDAAGRRFRASDSLLEFLKGL